MLLGESTELLEEWVQEKGTEPLTETNILLFDLIISGCGQTICCVFQLLSIDCSWKGWHELLCYERMWYLIQHSFIYFLHP